MKIKKKTIIITAAGLTALGVGGWYLAQNLRSSQVDVYPVSELSQSIWQSGTSLEGTIASQVSQEVHLQDKQIVSAVTVFFMSWLRYCRICHQKANGRSCFPSGEQFHEDY